MAIAVAFSAAEAAADTTTATAYIADTSTVTGFVLAVGDYSASGAAIVSDSKSNTWTPLTRHTDASVQPTVRLYYCLPTTLTSGPTGHEFFAAGVSSYCSIAVLALTGNHLTTFYDGSEVGGWVDDNTALATGSLTPTEDNCLVVTACGIGPTGTGHTVAGYTVPHVIGYNPGANFGVAIAYQIQTTATATNPSWTWTSSGDVAVTVAAFRSSGGGAGPATDDARILIAPVGFA